MMNNRRTRAKKRFLRRATFNKLHPRQSCFPVFRAFASLLDRGSLELMTTMLASSEALATVMADTRALMTGRRMTTPAKEASQNSAARRRRVFGR